LGLFCGAVTQRIGIHALFGFFIAGVMAGGAKALSERTRQVISQMVYAVFVPIFFASIGLKIDFFKNFDILLVLFISVIGILGRFLGAWMGVGFTGLSRSKRASIAIAHTPGGAMEIVVGILALEYKLITEPVFVAIVFGALISSIIIGPWLSYSVRKRKKVSILEYFSRRDIVSEVKFDNRDKAIRELSELAEGHEDTPGAEEVYSAVMKRENAMGTALEEGVAVPHARFVSLKRPVIIFGKSRTGIEWDSPDGKLTNFIFLILTPELDDVQVQLLAVIARAMSDGETRDLIMKAKDAFGIWDVLQKIFTAEHIVRK
jgi:mannitol/fructose-specific phosphotransferase system IIA component (Ntr-type)